MDELLKVALLGTAKVNEAAIPVPHELFAEWQSPGIERTVLMRAGADAVYRQAGRPLAKEATAPAAAPPETQPVVSAEITRILNGLLLHPSRDLISEALLQETLHLMRETGKIVHPACLPVLLDLSQANFRQLARPVLGERGRWLSQFRPEWNWATSVGTTDLHDAAPQLPANADVLWQEGDKGSRVELLRLARTVDTERARRWLMEVWSAEKADRRLDFLKTFQVGLSAADIPFLEDNLKDRSANVRALSAEYLAQLPDSPTAIRLRDRVAGIFADQGTGPRRLTVQPPQEFVKEWTREGLEAKPPAGTGERAFWLSQLLGLVPPSHWQLQFKMTPEELIATVSQDDYAATVVEAWSTAAMRCREIDWIPALWDYWFQYKPQGQRDPFLAVAHRLLTELISQMDPAAAETRLMHLFQTGDRLHEVPVDSYLLRMSRPWTEPFSRYFLGWMRTSLGSVNNLLDRNRGNFIQCLQIAAVAVPPGCFVEATGPFTLPDVDHYLVNIVRERLDEFVQTIRLRERLRSELGLKPVLPHQ